MNTSRKLHWFGLILALSTVPLEGNLVQAQGDAPPKKATKSYRADFSVYSIIPEKGIESYRPGGTMSVRPGGSTECGIFSATRQIQVVSVGRLNHQRFIVDVKIKGVAEFDLKPAQELDLTDLRSETIELAKDEDGRVYRLNISPQVHVSRSARFFRPEHEQLDEWSFHDSPVILNDLDYLGTIGMSGGNLASIDIPGLAHIQFSLLPILGGTPEGVLERGTLTVRHGDNSVTIKEVGNGEHGDTLKGGPYTVFVRWMNPTQTVEEYRERLKLTIDSVKERLSDDKTAVANEMILKLERLSKIDRVFLLGSSITNAQPNELDRSQK